MFLGTKSITPIKSKGGSDFRVANKGVSTLNEFDHSNVYKYVTRL
jgi:hypothetical protein